MNLFRHRFIQPTRYVINAISQRLFCGATESSKVKEISDTPTSSSTLLGQLIAQIKMTGPITVAQYMKEVLTNPLSGYYMKRDVFGSGGDFITSPEISQLFGEMVAIWLLNEWSKVGCPRPFQLIEMGPGRGSLSADILRVFKHFKQEKDMSIHLVEVSPHLSKIQEERLNVAVSSSNNRTDHYKTGLTKSDIPVFWYERIQDVPKQFSLVIAHEFFDALPIHKLQKTKNGWREVLIGIDDNENLTYLLSPTHTPASKFYIESTEMREHLEISLETILILKHIASRLEETGGIGLIADYGHLGEKSDTFRAFKNHKLHNPLDDPGSADLTADVDFKILCETLQLENKLITYGPVYQRDFLLEMNMNIRLKMLMENASTEDQKALENGYKIMTDSDKMGERFKLVSLFPCILQEHLKRFPVVGFNKQLHF